MTTALAMSTISNADESIPNQPENDSTLEGSTQGERRRRVRTVDAWEQYQTYAMRSGYLLNLGFSQPASCAVYLMRSIDKPTMDNVTKILAMQKERSVVFESVISNGIELLSNSGFYSGLSNETLKEITYQAMFQVEYLINTSMLTMGNGTVPSPERYKSMYENSGCATHIGFELKPE
jgi:hypothetical protein